MRMEQDKLLKLRDSQYSDLLAQWKTAVSKIYKCRNETGLTNYRIPKEAEGTELRFMAFGMNLFMRFRHSFDQGIIEYGVITDGEVDNQKVKLPVATIRFDREGNVRPPHNWHPIREYDKVHLEVLASHLDDFIKVANGEEMLNDGKETRLPLSRE